MNVSKYILLILCLSVGYTAQAQFNKKLTFSFGGGAALPLGRNISPIDPDGVPYMFSNYDIGTQLNVGLQYNIKSHISVGATIRSVLLSSWKDPLPATDPTRSIDNFPVAFDLSEFNAFYLSNGLGINGQYKFFANKRIIPYIWAEFNVNVISAEAPPRQRLLSNSEDLVSVLRFNAKSIEYIVRAGFTTGVGVDFKISESVKLFAQGDLTYIFVNNQPDLRRDSQYLAFSVGTRLSIFKSKSFIE